MKQEQGWPGESAPAPVVTPATGQSEPNAPIDAQSIAELRTALRACQLELARLRAAPLRRESAALPQLTAPPAQATADLHEAFWLTDAGRPDVVAVSSSYTEITGIACAESVLSPEQFRAALIPEDRERARAAGERQMRGEATREEYRVLRPDGAVRHVLDRTLPIKDEAGRVIRVVGLTSDVTPLQQTLNQLHEQRDLLREIMDATTDIVAVRDRDLRYVMMNRAGRELSPTLAKCVGQTDLELYPLAEAQLFQARDCEVLETGASQVAEEPATLDEVTHNFLTARSAQRDAHGAIIGVIAVTHDLTDVKRATAQLRQAERLASIGTLAAGIAHEINNPVGGILLSAEGALDELTSTGDRTYLATCLKEIMEDAKRCGRIIQSILRFARQQPTEKWPNDINALVRRTIHLTREAVARRGGELSVQLAPDLPEVAINPTEFEQVLINLIQNAVEAGGKGTSVVIQSQRQERGVRLRVTDNGPGMTPQQLAHVFDPFFTTRQQVGGTGLGLSVVHGIVAAHGGRIHVDSAPQQGTTFTIDLPG